MYNFSTNKRGKELSDWPTMAITLFACLLCWVIGYVYSVGFPLADGNTILPVWEHFCNALSSITVAYIVGLFLFMLIAYIIQRISDIEMFIHHRTRLPFMIFILLISTNAGLLPVGGTTIVLLCSIFMIYELFNSYQQPEATGALFNAGVFVGVASLFTPQILLIAPLLWVGMYQFRSFSPKSFIASLIGILIIYWFVLAWCIWQHDFSMFALLYSSITDFDFFDINLKYHQIGIVCTILLFVLAFVYIRVNAFNNSVRVRQMLSFLFNISIWPLFLILLYGKSSDTFLAMSYLPSSVLIAYLFESIERRLRFILYYSMLALWVGFYMLRVWNFS